MSLDSSTGNVAFGNDTPAGPIDIRNLDNSTRAILDEMQDTTNEGGTVDALLKIRYDYGGGLTTGYINVRGEPA